MNKYKFSFFGDRFYLPLVDVPLLVVFRQQFYATFTFFTWAYIVFGIQDSRLSHTLKSLP